MTKRSALKIVGAIIVVLSVLIVFEYAHQGYINDMSIQPVNRFSAPDLEAPEPTGRPPVFLVTYAAGGEQYFRNQNAVNQFAVNKGIDFILNYRKSHIDVKFFDKNREIFNEKVGAGMWVWKPYVILRTLESAPEGSIVLYLDSAFKIRKPVPRFLDQLGDKDIMLVQDQDRLNGAYVKGDTFHLMNCMEDSCRQSSHIWSALIVIRNSPQSRKIIKQWLEACENIEILSGTGMKYVPNFPEYKWHHYDQSVLSLVYYKNRDAIKLVRYDDVDKYFIWFHRKAGRHSQLKPWYTVYGAEPAIATGDGYKKLSSWALLNLTPLVYIRKLLNKDWDVGG